MDNDKSYKILILGESQVGKTSILTRFIENKYINSLPPTLGIDYKIKKLKIHNKTIKLQIWDTAGQERFRSITESFYKSSNGIFLVFDITNKKSFQKIKIWLENIFQKSNENIVIVLLANKSDLKFCDGFDFVTDEEIEAICYEFGIKFFFVSAKSGENIYEVFFFLAVECCKVEVRELESFCVERKEGKKRKCC